MDLENDWSTGFPRGTGNCCPANIEKYLSGNGSDRRAYREPKKTHGGSSLCGAGFPPVTPIVLCCGRVGFMGSTPASEAIHCQHRWVANCDWRKEQTWRWRGWRRRARRAARLIQVLKMFFSGRRRRSRKARQQSRRHAPGIHKLFLTSSFQLRVRKGVVDSSDSAILARLIEPPMSAILNVKRSPPVFAIVFLPRCFAS